MTLGVHHIKYEFESANGCTSYQEKTIEIVGSTNKIFTVVPDNGGAYCFSDANGGVAVKLSGSETGIKYELLFEGNSLDPVVENDGTGA
jgi:hypothetical protein